jgi:D-amino-acid dehydrogenase
MTNLVIGAGLVGITSAYELLKRGQSVTLLEQQEGPALGASFANAGMLTPSMSDPWNSPGVYKYLAKSLFNPSSSMRLKLNAIPSLMGWGAKFLRYSSEPYFNAALKDNFNLTTYSLRKTQDIADKYDLQYCRKSKGTLSIFNTPEDFSVKEGLYNKLSKLGLKCSILNPDEIISLVPSLASIRSQLHKGIHYHQDESGDAHLFCKALLAKYLEAGGQIQYGVSVKSLAISNNKITGVNTESEFIPAKRVVVACGANSPSILKSVNINLDVKPAKGYSLTINVDGVSGLPSLPVLNDAMNVVVTPLGNRLRLVGTAEFAGFDLSIDKKRMAALFEMFEYMYPEIASQVDQNSATPWAGLRPMSCDGKPFIGASKIKGLYINSGQGPLGWTLAMGSANLIADIMLSAPTEIDAKPFSMIRADRNISV